MLSLSRRPTRKAWTTRIERHSSRWNPGRWRLIAPGGGGGGCLIEEILELDTRQPNVWPKSSLSSLVRITCLRTWYYSGQDPFQRTIARHETASYPTPPTLNHQAAPLQSCHDTPPIPSSSHHAQTLPPLPRRAQHTRTPTEPSRLSLDSTGTMIFFGSFIYSMSSQPRPPCPNLTSLSSCPARSRTPIPPGIMKPGNHQEES